MKFLSSPPALSWSGWRGYGLPDSLRMTIGSEEAQSRRPWLR